MNDLPRMNELPITEMGIAIEEAEQANAEVRRLRRGIVNVLVGSLRNSMDAVRVRKALYELVAGDAANPLRPEWDHHIEDFETLRDNLLSN